MCTLLKFISTIILTCFCLTNANSQTNAQADTSSYHRLQVYRQIFWDNLPKPVGWTNDYENLFTDVEELHLDSLIKNFENKTSIQICIVTLDSTFTTENNFDNLALHIANVWGVGQRDKNNGVVICISAAHRRIRVCNGYGIEKDLTDTETKEIVKNDFILPFKNGNYYQGTLNGLTAIISKLNDKIKINAFHGIKAAANKQYLQKTGGRL